MADFFRQNAAAIIALAGVTIGSVLTGAFALWNSWVLRNRDLNLKLWERFLDRRIVAHEAVVELAVKMRVVVSLGWVDPSGEIARAPQMMMSKEAFDSWIIEFTQKSAPPTTWVSTPVKR